VVLQRLRAERLGTELRLTGRYATFAGGDLIHRTLGGDGRPLGEQVVATAEAGGDLPLDVRVDDRPGGYAVELLLSRPQAPAAVLDAAVIADAPRESGRSLS
jgi:hypothetical protein